MNIISIGELIKRRRIERKLTQEQLCEGICEPSNLSRIENGYQVPSRSKLLALLQRLELPSEKYYALLSDVEIEISNLQAEITSHMVCRNHEQGLIKLEQLQNIMDCDDQILQQFVLRAQVAFGKKTECGIIPYSLEERLSMLYQALRITLPKFDIEHITDYILSKEEVQIINQIAITYTNEHLHKQSIPIFYELMKYVKKHLRTLNQSHEWSPTVILITYNYASALYFDGRFADSLEIADLGLQCSIETHSSVYLGSLLYIKAQDLYHLNLIQESKQFFLQSYYVYRSINDSYCAENVHHAIHEYFHIDLNI